MLKFHRNVSLKTKSKPKKPPSSDLRMLLVGFFLGLLFYPEDGTGKYSYIAKSYYIVLHSRRQYVKL
jgi:hypothetical protein